MTFRHAGPTDDTGLAEFFRQVWDPAATPASAAEARTRSAGANPVDPGRVPPIFVAAKGDRIIGHLGTIPARFWGGRRERGGYWLKGLMVLEEYRGGPVGFGLVREAAKLLPLSAAMVVTEPARRLFGACGFRDVGAMPNFIRPIRAGRLAARINPTRLGLSGVPAPFFRSIAPLAQRLGVAWAGGALIGGLLRVRAASSRPFGGSAAGLPANDALDGLWRLGRRTLVAGAVRDAAEINARYVEAADGAYRVGSAVNSSGVLLGVAVVRVPRANPDPRLEGLVVASLSDLWFDLENPAAGLATLGVAEGIARSLGADALLYSNGHRAVLPLLRAQGYFRLGGNVHLLTRDVDGQCRWPESLSDWWVSRGDAKSDEVF